MNLSLNYAEQTKTKRYEQFERRKNMNNLYFTSDNRIPN